MGTAATGVDGCREETCLEPGLVVTGVDSCGDGACTGSGSAGFSVNWRGVMACGLGGDACGLVVPGVGLSPFLLRLGKEKNLRFGESVDLDGELGRK